MKLRFDINPPVTIGIKYFISIVTGDLISKHLSLSRIFCGITQVNSVKLRMLLQNGFHPIEYYIPKFYVLFMSGIY